MCHGTKFQQNRPSSFGDIAVFKFSRWQPSAIVNFEILKLLVAYQNGRANMHRYAKFHQNRYNSCRDITLNVFQNGGPPPSWIVKN